MEGKKSVKKRVLIIVCSVLLIFVAAAGVLLIRNGLKQETYKEAIQTAEKYVAEQNYEDAIVAYENAISAVPDREEPYMGLADVYLIQDKVSLARSTLEKGYAATNSKSIYSMIQGIDNGSLLINRFDQQQTKETMEKRGELGWNQAFLQRLEDYTYTDYSDEYGGWPDITKVSKGEVKVVYDDLPATLYYSDTAEDDDIVDDSKNQPAEDGMPEKVELDSVAMLFNNFALPVTLEEIQTISSSTVRPITTDERTYIQITTGSVDMKIETDSSGNIVSENAWNEIMLPDANKDRDRKGTLKGVVIDAMTGDGVPDAEIRFEARENKAHSDSAVTGQSGAFSIELEADTYDVMISADGYVAEEFEFEVEKDKNYSGEQFVISPALAEGTARIVLEWGAEPRDLDSYLTGETESGTDVFVGFYRKTCSSGGETIAELDVDDTSGYGPETITLYDLNGVYRYVVVDYRLTETLQEYGATVKVYLPDQAQPEVITVEPNAGIENIWEVFELDHGELHVLNRAGDENSLREGNK